ncbi:hypothetical protein V6N13_068953 [Hibiscus sabdariffa]
MALPINTNMIVGSRITVFVTIGVTETTDCSGYILRAPSENSAKQLSAEEELHIASKADANAQLLKSKQLAVLKALIVIKNVILDPTIIFVLMGNAIAYPEKSVVSVTPIVTKTVILDPTIIFVLMGNAIA